MARRSGNKQETPVAETAKPYHHGNLRDELVAEALALSAESGIESVTVREVARRAGVSPGAPFRHFADKTALMTAVAEEALRRFQEEIESALAPVAADDAPGGVRAIGLAFLEWAIRNPTHFEIISTRRAIDFQGSAYLVAQNRAIQERLAGFLAAAQAKGLLRSPDIQLAQVTARAMVYGLARMLIDGQLPSWNVDDKQARAFMVSSLDLFLAGFFREKP